MQVDVEGCELQALQGIQPEHWAHVQQVSPASDTRTSVLVLAVSIACMPRSCMQNNCCKCDHTSVIALPNACVVMPDCG